MDRPENCSGCTHYKHGVCRNNFYRKTVRKPDEVCNLWEPRTRLDDIQEWFEGLAEWKSWLLLRFAICVLCAITVVVGILAIIFIIAAVGAALSPDYGCFPYLLFGTVLTFLTWCGIGVIKRLWDCMEEVF